MPQPLNLNVRHHYEHSRSHLAFQQASEWFLVPTLHALSRMAPQALQLGRLVQTVACERWKESARGVRAIPIRLARIATDLAVLHRPKG